MSAAELFYGSLGSFAILTAVVLSDRSISGTLPSLTVMSIGRLLTSTLAAVFA